MAQRLNIYSDGCERLRPNTRQHCDVVVSTVVSQKGPDFDCTIWPGPVYVSFASVGGSTQRELTQRRTISG